MSNMLDALPAVVPFFGIVLMVSLSTTCVFWRRTRRNLNILSDRVAALEARQAAPVPPTPTVMPVYNMPPYRPNYYPSPNVSYPIGVMPSAPPNSVNL